MNGFAYFCEGFFFLSVACVCGFILLSHSRLSDEEEERYRDAWKDIP